MTGFVYHSLPAKRLGNSDDEGKGISDSTLDLIWKLPYKGIKDYVVGLDNLFTTPKVMRLSREENVAVVGTARHRRGCPLKEMKNFTDDRFNTMYSLV